MYKNAKVEKHAMICEELHDLYITKNADYGDSVGELYSKLGDITLLTRITDKYNRLMNIFSNPHKAIHHETIDDNIKDLANYCIIWAMERELKIEDEPKLELKKYGDVINTKLSHTDFEKSMGGIRKVIEENK